MRTLLLFVWFLLSSAFSYATVLFDHADETVYLSCKNKDRRFENSTVRMGSFFDHIIDLNNPRYQCPIKNRRGGLFFIIQKFYESNDPTFLSMTLTYHCLNSKFDQPIDGDTFKMELARPTTSDLSYSSNRLSSGVLKSASKKRQAGNKMLSYHSKGPIEYGININRENGEAKLTYSLPTGDKGSFYACDTLTSSRYWELKGSALDKAEQGWKARLAKRKL